MRVAVALVALVALGWLAVMERDAVFQQRGLRAAGKLSEPGNAARAQQAFDAARLMNPDTDPVVGRAVVYLVREQRPRAAALLEDVVRAEPDNLAAWTVLYNVSLGHDQATARRALAARVRLDPLCARRQR